MSQDTGIVPDQDAVAAQRDRILSSDGFARSARSRDLLRYVVDEALAGRGDRISATSIAQDVLGKGDDFDSSSDPVVRVQMGRMRSLLSAWYDENHDADVRIEVPKGTYRPAFSTLSADSRTLAASDEEAEPAPGKVAPSAAAPTAAPSAAEEGAAPSERFFLRPGHLVTVALIGALALIAGVALLMEGRDANDGYPIVVVRPFQNLTGDPANDMVADGLKRQLASDLQRFKTVRVAVEGVDPGVNPASSPRRLGRRAKPAQPDYAVTGTVLSAVEDLDFTLDLIDLSTGTLISRERYGGQRTGNYFDLVADLSRSATGGIVGSGGALNRAELAQLEGAVALPAGGERGAFRCLGLFEAFANFKTPDRARAAFDCLEDAVASHPRDSTLLAALAWTTAIIAPDSGLLDAGSWTDDLSLEDALRLAERAVEFGPGDDKAHEFLGLIQWRLGETRSGLLSLRRAASLNPGNAHLLADLGLHLAFAGQWEEAERLTALAFDRSGDAPGWFSLVAAFDAMLDGRGQQALRLLEVAAPGDPYGEIYLLAAAAIANDADAMAQYRPAVARIAAANGGDPLASVRLWIRSPEIIAMLERELAKAGVPAQTAG